MIYIKVQKKVIRCMKIIILYEAKQSHYMNKISCHSLILSSIDLKMKTLIKVD